MFGIELIDASLLGAMMVALAAGVLSFLSPCVLPIVPPYLAYMAGISPGDVDKGARGQAVPAAIFFVLGLSTVFVLMGLGVAALGGALAEYRGALTRAAGLVLMLFGLHFLAIIRIPFLDREARLDAGDRGGSLFGAYVLGLAFAFGWTPCIGPILSAILTLVIDQGSMSRGVALMGVYALGLGLPFILVAVFLGRAMRVMGALRAHMGKVERISGLMLWTIGLMILTGSFSDLSFWLLDAFPTLGLVG